MVNWSQYIIRDPNILFGKPTFKGTRVPVDLVLEKLSYGEKVEELLLEYPHLTQNHIYAALAFASESVRGEVVFEIEL